MIAAQTRHHGPHQNHRTRGVALMLVVILMAIGVILAMGFLATQSTATGITANVTKQAQARSIAETALLQTLRFMRSDQNWRAEEPNGAWFTNQSLNGGTYTLSVVDPVDGNLFNDPTQTANVTVTAAYQGVTHTINAVARPSIPVVRRLLFVVHNTASLTTQESAKKALFLGWSYTVDLIADTDTLANYTTQFTSHDVVFVSAEATSSSIGTKLQLAPIGVVTELPDTDQRILSATSAGTTFSGTSINISNNTHYITLPFSLGALVISSSANTLAQLNGTMASGGTLLATTISSTTTNTLIAQDPNTAASDGSMTWGRRAVLPWGNSGFNVNLLTSDGRTLFHRTLDWASQPVVPRSPIAHWTMNETSGNICYDSVGTNHGTYENGVTLGVSGPLGNAAGFNGQNQYVLVPNAPALNLTSAITITAWGYATTWSNGNHRFLQKGNADNQYRFLEESSQFKFDLTGVGTLATNTLPTLNQWVHVAGTYDGTRMCLYYNGQLIATQNVTGSIATTGDPLQLGTKKVGAPMSDSFIGNIDDVQIYDYGLNAAEVNYLYSQGTTTPLNPVPQLVASYNFVQTTPQPNLLNNWKLDETSGGGGAAAAGSVSIGSLSVVASYDSRLGAYGAGNTGASAAVSTNSTSSGAFSVTTFGAILGNAYCGSGGTVSSVFSTPSSSGITGTKSAMSSNVTMPTVAAPTGMPATQGSVTLASNTAWSANQHYNALTISGGTVTVSGTVTVLCDSNFTMSGTAQVVIPSGSHLNLYVSGAVLIQNNAQLNGDSSGPGRLNLYQISTSSSNTTTIQDSAVVSGIVYSKQNFSLAGLGYLFGRLLTAGTISTTDSSMLVLDISQPSLGPASPPAIDSVSSDNGTYQSGAAGGGVGDGDGGTSATFDGANDYISIPHTNSMLLNTGTVSFWFKPTSVSGTHGLFSKTATGNGTGGHLLISTSSNKVVATLSSSSGANSITGSTTLSTGTWYNVVFTFGPSGMNLYINNTLAGTNTYNGGLANTSGGTGNYEAIILGADSSGSATLTYSTLANYFAGQIDDVRLYDNELTSTQVGNVYAHATSLTASAAASKVVYDTAGAQGSPLNLYIPDTTKITWVSGGGLSINSATKIESPSAATKLSSLLSVNNQVSIDVIFTPANVTQTGPAQIFGYSSSPTTQNFSLGESAQAYIHHMRTSGTASSGGPDLSSGNITATPAQVHFIATFDGTTFKIYKDNALVVSDSRAGNFSTWDTTMKFMLGNEETNNRPWLGTLTKVAIYDRAFNQYQLAHAFAGQPPGNGTGQQNLMLQWNENPQ